MKVPVLNLLFLRYGILAEAGHVIRHGLAISDVPAATPCPPVQGRARPWLWARNMGSTGEGMGRC